MKKYTVKPQFQNIVLHRAWRDRHEKTSMCKSIINLMPEEIKEAEDDGSQH